MKSIVMLGLSSRLVYYKLRPSVTVLEVTMLHLNWLTFCIHSKYGCREMENHWDVALGKTDLSFKMKALNV